MSLGGGSNKSSGTQTSTSEAKNFGSNVWAPQSPFLQDIYNKAQANLGNLGGINDATQYLQGAGAALGSANNALNQSNQALTGFLNPGQDPAVAAYAQNLGQQFNEQFLPGLKGDAALAGGLGGSRQQIGAALGAQRAMQSLGDFTANIYSDQQQRALQAATQIGANAQGFQGNAEAGAGLADFARGMPWYQLAQYQGLIGAPTMQDLGGYSKSKSTGSSSSGGWNANFSLGSG